MVDHIGARAEQVESAAAEAISDHYRDTAAEPEAETEPIFMVAITPDGDHAYVTSELSHSVSVIAIGKTPSAITGAPPTGDVGQPYHYACSR
ncbi:hypothetical protein [Rhodococcus marinonascens]|uniref:hypothetical protein n=1 Tax=Rhodococcus marinonascens TaxID=38311 RepID=UPI0009337FA2|nr:hypothetical protein [Rhodococcus marinonascens]